MTNQHTDYMKNQPSGRTGSPVLLFISLLIYPWLQAILHLIPYHVLEKTCTSIRISNDCITYRSSNGTKYDILHFVRGFSHHQWLTIWAQSMAGIKISQRHQCLFFRWGWESTSRILSSLSIMYTKDVLGPVYQHGLTLIIARISNRMPCRVCDEVTYPLPNCIGGMEMDK